MNITATSPLFKQLNCKNDCLAGAKMSYCKIS